MTHQYRSIASMSAALALLVSEPSFAREELPKITLDQAYGIAKALTRYPDNLGLDILVPPEENGFYRLVTIPMFPRAEGTGPTLAVNVWTGDVWDIKYCFGRSVPRVDSPAARKLRIAIRTRLGLSAKAYRRLANRRPECLF